MKGVVFDLLNEVVSRQYGLLAWGELIDASGVDGTYTSLGNYPDEEFMSIVAAAAPMFGKSETEVVRWLGREALPIFAERYPMFFAGHSSARTFLLTLEDIIHPEVRRLYPGAAVPSFRFETPASGVLVMSYSSQRQLCAFGEGLIEGAAEHFGEDVRIDQSSCTGRGDPECVFEVTLTRQG
ncbi:MULTISPECIES: heme NO-binding domain-containing protein [unclassified Kitasatospora]|uniref:heme NO-binding domain-containing protein n=1 Tax=unclassified Kitasatospora TaxID=2633591 RepID=UPI0033D3529A